ncbi:threonine/homoserine/homoserine lactone efflux protein [Spelaeicoccus albus]|uniref:Threonine/homoserine/homoserine lactone efflux protein n=1 Tax=Spelaeicoccus albus TaxID=1280376 RepID=A0A7Z0D2Z5_9MICO|nr:threonine/homoserine/homoserine lactone efflux protein [Spelaeicoccus albus]
MTAQQVLTFAAACVVLIVVPGPAVMFVIGRTLAEGRRSAILSILGNSIGSYLVAAVVALGLGNVLAKSEIVFTVVKYAGAAYLVYLGVQAIRHRRDVTAPTGSASPPGSDAPSRRVRGNGPRQFRQGVVVGITNPKVYIVFAAILPQFVRAGAGNLPAQMLVLALVPLVIGLVTDSAWAFAAGAARAFFGKSPRRLEAFSAVGGCAIIGLGVTTALTKA